MDSDFLKKEKEFLNNIVYKLYKNKKPEKIIFRAFILFKDVFILLHLQYAHKHLLAQMGEVQLIALHQI